MSRNNLPKWFKIVCCTVPLVTLLVTTLSISFGIAVSPVTFTVVAALAWSVIAQVLGIASSPLVVSLPNLRHEREKLTE